MDERGRRRRTTIWIAVGVFALVLLGVALYATGEPSFCGTCHEMKPAVAGFESAPHAKLKSCFPCHAEPGPIGYLKAHIGDGLRDVYWHFTKRPDVAHGAKVPRQRCLACHADKFKDQSFVDAHPGSEQAYCPRCHRHQMHSQLHDELQ